MIFYKKNEASTTRIMKAVNYIPGTPDLIANNYKSDIFLAGITNEVKRKQLEVT